jgi:hypothetical protein
MSSPRFVPKSFAAVPKQFGSASSIAWKPARAMSPAQRDNLVAAQVQHAIALRIRRRIELSGLTIETAARANDMEPDQLGRLLRGDAIMRLEHIAWAERSFGLDLLSEWIRRLE